MIKGKEKEKKESDFIDADELLIATNGGYDVFRYYLGEVKREMNRPWGRKERKASWGVFPNPKNRIWYWKDMAKEESGTAIQFVMRYFGLDFKGAVQKIAWDFGIGGKEKNASPVVITWDKPDIDRDHCLIRYSTQPFQAHHHLYWNDVEVGEEDCKRFNCEAVKDLAINGRKVNIKRGEPVFAYYSPEEDGAKIYFPMRPDAKFKNNVSYHYLWNFSNIKECDNLIIQKSCKDMIVTGMISECVIATQAEAIKIFDKETVDRINSITKHPWVWYGSDWDGVKKCKQITDTNGWKYINTPKNLLPEINDVYLYVKKFGLKKLEEFMKQKGVI